MNMVGKVGSLISQGVYSVATPFHPFGGAVDVIVVEQQDGTYRSTPWYVRFGKFQGVLKGAEKIVRISVNGVEANFHMYLDNSGEAYFVREIVKDGATNDGSVENSDDSATVPQEDGDNSNCKDYNAHSFDSNGFNGNDNLCHNVSNLSNIDEIPFSDNKCARYSRPDQLQNGEVDNDRSCVYEFQDDRSSNVDLVESSTYKDYGYESLDHVEDVVEQRGSDSEMVLVSVDGHVLMAPISSSEENPDNVQLNTPQFHLGPGEESDFNGGDEEFNDGQETWAAQYLSKIDGSALPRGESEAALPICDSKISGDLSENCELGEDSAIQSQDVTQNSSHVEIFERVEQQDSDSPSPTLDKKEIFKSCIELADLNLGAEDEDSQEPSSELESKNKIEVFQENSPNFPTTQQEYAYEGDNEPENCAGSHCENSEPSCSGRSQGLGMEIYASNNESLLIHKSYCLGSDINSCSDTYDLHTKDEQLNSTPEAQERECSSGRLEPELECSRSAGEESKTQNSGMAAIKSSRGMGFEISLCGNLLRRGMGLNPANEAFDAHRISEDEFKVSASSLVKNENLIVRYKSRFFRWEKAAHIVLGMAAFGLDFPFEPSDTFSVEEDVASSPGEDASGITSTQSSRRWRLWPIPFRRVKTLQHTNSNASSEEVFLDSESAFQSSEVQTPSAPSAGSESPRKKLVRTNVPTTEQIASLNLKDGQNMVAFSFSTRVLGTQQVDAHIYLWKWNARIVISDVDGTITRSDVLGQFMPLVGKDWSQSGVAHLFSAIKENGYQLLFLSARAIVQAYLTRSFLLNLKQDGKTLPSGPVVISPDGLFPALYREDYKQLRNSLLDLQNVADQIFDVISERTAQESQKLTDLSRRIQVPKVKHHARIDDIAHSKKDIVIKSPSNYPSHSKDAEDFKPLFGYNESGVGFPVAELLVNGGLNRDCGEDGTLELFQFFSETHCDFRNKVLEQAPSMSTNSRRNKSIEDVLGLPNFIYNSLLKEVNVDMDSSIETKEQSLPPPPPSLLDSMRVKSRNIPKWPC